MVDSEFVMKLNDGRKVMVEASAKYVAADYANPDELHDLSVIVTLADDVDAIPLELSDDDLTRVQRAAADSLFREVELSEMEAS